MTTKQKMISAKEVSELRQRTGAGMMDCKKALEETGGDMEAAIELLRKSGAAKAEKRVGRAASEGMIISAETTGKYKMALQVIAIVLLILEGTVLSEYGNVHLAGIVTLYLSLVLGYLSGGQYVWSFWRQISLKGL